jgi:hypothetical protein
MLGHLIAPIFPAHSPARVLWLVATFLLLVQLYSRAGRLLLRRVATTPRGVRMLPALYGAGLGLWIAIIWLAFR